MRFGNRYVVKIAIISVSIINSSSANVWQHSGNYNAHTRGRTDHFNISNSSNKQVLGCYLFTVSNSGLLFSHGRFVSYRNIHPWPKKEHFSSRNHELWHITLTFHLDYRWTTSQRSLWKVVVRTQSQPTDCSTWTTNVVSKDAAHAMYLLHDGW